MKRRRNPEVSSSTTSAITSPPPEILRFRGEFHFLSNFFKSPIVQDGIEYPTVEHAFQAAKCLDRASKLKLVENKNPVIAKRLGRRVQLRPDWESVKLDLMHEILSLKFAQGSELAGLLLATGESDLIEGNTWHDNFWGACQCDKHRASRGANHLGKLLMRVRDELRKNAPDNLSKKRVTEEPEKPSPTLSQD